MQITFNETTLHLVEHTQHEFLLSNKEVALGYGITQKTVNDHRSNHKDELIEGKHWLRLEVQTKGGKQKVIHWTKKGIVRLGFFIKSKEAKAFRDWAEDYIVHQKADENAPYIHQLERENIELKRAMNRLLLTGSADEELLQLKVKHRVTFPTIIEYFKRVEKKAKLEDAECYLVDIKNLLEREAKKINSSIMLGDMTMIPANMMDRDEAEHFKHMMIT